MTSEAQKRAMKKYADKRNFKTISLMLDLDNPAHAKAYDIHKELKDKADFWVLAMLEKYKKEQE